MRTVFLTGATGFIGGRLARRLSGRGDRMRCLIRASSRSGNLRELGAELVVGELNDVDTLTRAMKGCDVAYHLAAIYDIGVVSAAELQRVNVSGTRAFVEAATRAGVPRAVYVSTTVALGPSDGGADENLHEYAGPYPSTYHRTKAEAHRLAREAMDRGAPLIIACPAFVYGPGDAGPGGRFIADLLRRRVPALLTSPAWFSYVHVEDVASGLELIGEHGRLGGTYVLSGEAASMNAFAERVAKVGGVKPPPLKFPPAVAELTGRLLDPLSRLSGIRLPISREAVATTARDRWIHSHARAERELGWKPRTLNDGLPETVAWFRGQLSK